MFCANPKCPNPEVPLEEIYGERRGGYAAERRYCSLSCSSQMPRPRARKPRALLEDRFWAKVKVGAPTECWEWVGARDNYGYGFMFRSRNPQRYYKAHRLSWELANGRELADDEFILHACDWPPCVNPAHLSAGTKGDNNRDRAAKGRGRHPSGLESTSSKLTAEQVREIRKQWRAGKSQSMLAREYPVGQAQISRIVRNVVYKDVK